MLPIVDAHALFDEPVDPDIYELVNKLDSAEAREIEGRLRAAGPVVMPVKIDEAFLPYPVRRQLP